MKEVTVNLPLDQYNKMVEEIKCLKEGFTVVQDSQYFRDKELISTKVITKDEALMRLSDKSQERLNNEINSKNYWHNEYQNVKIKINKLPNWIKKLYKL